MIKTHLARNELEHIALLEIRSFPGCENMTSIEIADDLLCTWTLHASPQEGANRLHIRYATNVTSKNCSNNTFWKMLSQKCHAQPDLALCI